MSARLVLLACLGLGLSAGPALALKNTEGCDIVAFASKGASLSIAPERWQVYREASEAALAPGSNPRALAAGMIEAQQDLLAPIKQSSAYRGYLSGDTCRVLAKLNARAVEALLAEAAQTTTGATATALGQVIEAARAQFDRIERTARFTSNRAKSLYAAEYYCFVAGAIMAFLPPERRETIALEDFGQTVSCKEAGRSG